MNSLRILYCLVALFTKIATCVGTDADLMVTECGYDDGVDPGEGCQNATGLWTLMEGDVLQIRGRTQLSPFVSWIGCTVNVENTTTPPLDSEPNLFDCIAACDDYGLSSYIGLMETACLCFNQEPMEFVDDKFCSTPCSGVSEENCGSVSTVAVYTTKVVQALLEEGEIGNQQCIYVFNRSNDGVRFASESCYANDTNVKSFLCRSSTTGALSCSGPNSSASEKEPCLLGFEGGNGSWWTAKAACEAVDGRLTNVGEELASDALVPDQNTWTGVFRAIQPRRNWTFGNQIDSDGEMACLSVRKLNGFLKVEAHDCPEGRGKPKFCLCNSEDLITHSTDYSAPHLDLYTSESPSLEIENEKMTERITSAPLVKTSRMSSIRTEKTASIPSKRAVKTTTIPSRKTVKTTMVPAERREETSSYSILSIVSTTAETTETTAETKPTQRVFSLSLVPLIIAGISLVILIICVVTILIVCVSRMRRKDPHRDKRREESGPAEDAFPPPPFECLSETRDETEGPPGGESSEGTDVLSRAPTDGATDGMVLSELPVVVDPATGTDGAHGDGRDSAVTEVIQDGQDVAETVREDKAEKKSTPIDVPDKDRLPTTAKREEMTPTGPPGEDGPSDSNTTLAPSREVTAPDTGSGHPGGVSVSGDSTATSLTAIQAEQNVNIGSAATDTNATIDVAAATGNSNLDPDKKTVKEGELEQEKENSIGDSVTKGQVDSASKTAVPLKVKDGELKGPGSKTLDDLLIGISGIIQGLDSDEFSDLSGSKVATTGNT